VARFSCAEIIRDFHGRIVVLGFGTIGRCLLPMLRSSLPLEVDRYMVIDGREQGDDFFVHREAGIPYHVAHLERDNISATLGPFLDTGDLLINVTVGIDSVDLIDWCQRRDILYVDSSLEPWEEDVWNTAIPTHARTEYAYHQRARGHAWSHWGAGGPTAVVCHGANPGLVSHFVKAALLDVAGALEMDVATPSSREGWARLARQTGTRVIHVSERDTQVSREPKRPGEFVNTWSIPGFVEEASMPVEVGWGTHERRLPPGAHEHADGPRNAIYARGPAARALILSWLPLGGQIAGLALPHSESVTISEYLTVGVGEDVVYRPTVVFAYLPCDAALASLHEAMMRGWDMQAKWRILDEDVTEGRDELGVLLMGHGRGAWWYGSQLDIHEARRLVPGSNPTAVQVAAGILAAAVWAAANPRCGYCEPEALPHETVLGIARPYLGPMVSRASDWTPLVSRGELFEEPLVDRSDPWQFGNFLLC
jgi:homospermidine synthase